MLCSRHVRVIFANLWHPNPWAVPAVDALARHDPDVIALAELAPRKLATVTRRLRDHPYRLIVPTDRRCHLALFSRLPMTGAAVVRTGACLDRPFGQARIEGEHPCTVVFAHTTAPFTPAMAARRNAQIDCITTAAADVDGPLILLGDLNADHSSAPVRRLRAGARLLSPRAGARHHPTWPAPLPWRTYDHVLHSADFVAEDFVTLGARGSDHRPLLATFRLASPASVCATSATHGTALCRPS